MNPDRVRERGLCFTAVCAAHIDGLELTFDKQSADHPHSGHANVRRAPGARVEGVLYELLDHDEIRRMDPFERAPVNYSREVFAVVTHGGPVQAWIYVANAAVRVADLRPEAAYLAHLLCGRRWLSPAYGERLAHWPCAEPGDGPGSGLGTAPSVRAGLGVDARSASRSASRSTPQPPAGVPRS